jgi:hypothetical protein
MHGLRTVLVGGALATLLAVGCGGGGGPTPEEALAECRESLSTAFLSGFSEVMDPAFDAPEDAARQTGRLFCAEAVNQQLHELDPESAEFREGIIALVEEKPQVLYPLCEGSALSGFDTLPPELQTDEMRRETVLAGRRYCDITIEEGYFARGLERPATRAEVEAVADRIYREHPELITPTCVLGGMTGYESAPLVVEGVEVAPARARTYFERVCTEAAKAGAFSSVTLEPTPAQERKLSAIFERVLAEMIAAGELP